MKKLTFLALFMGVVLLSAAQPVLMGMTNSGGDMGRGVLFEYDPGTDTYTKKYDFGGPNGVYPYGSLTLSGGKLYGMTNGGGNGGAGVLFEYDPGNYMYTKKYDFGGTNGSYPQGSLTLSGGKLYGMTYGGGNSNGGVLFEYDLGTDTYTKKYDFEDTNGSRPYGSLTLSGGKLYGMTSLGGDMGRGVLFEYDPGTNTYTKKYGFDGTNGGTPLGSLTLSGGILYGMTNVGGNSNAGVLFEYDPGTDTYTKKFDFDGTNGGYPLGSLTLSGGKLYGMTNGGGNGGAGVLFEYDPGTDTYTKKFDFGDTNGASPYGSLTLSGGKLYGMTYGGGNSNGGVLFEYDPGTDTYTKKFDFGGTNGINPVYGSLLEINGCTPNTGTHTLTVCDSLTWIDGNTYTSSNNTATHTLTNIGGCDSVVTLDLTIVSTPSSFSTQSIVLYPVADSYTSSGSTSTNYGSLSNFNVDRSVNHAFLKFDLSDIPSSAQIIGAKLSVMSYMGYAYGNDGNVYTRFVSDDSWTENLINYSNRPAADETSHLGFWWSWYNNNFDERLHEIQTPALLGKVSDEYNGDGILSLRLNSPGYYTQYYSREEANINKRPKLTITYTVPFSVTPASIEINPGQYVTFTAAGTGGTINWYKEGVWVSSGNSFVSPVITNPTLYTVRESNGTCEGQFTDVNINIRATPTFEGRKAN